MRRSALALLALAAVALPSRAQVLWQIGQFDRSSAEFRGADRQKVVYRPGQSDWRRDWPGSQPATRPYEIVFSLGSKPGSAYTLTVAALTYAPRIPSLGVEINGHRGVFYFQPKLSYFPGDGQFAFDPHYSESTLKIGVPGAFLRAGENRIVLTSVDSEFHYDAASFARAAHTDSMTATVTPTIFYRHGAELVEAIIRFPGRISEGEAVLEMQGKRYTAPLTGGSDFGEQRIEFEVPEWTGETAARLTVAGEQRTFDVTLTSARKWTVFVVPHTHLDIGFTDYQGKVAEMQARVIQQAAALIRQHPDFRFSMDGSWDLEQLLNTRPPEKQQEILNMIREGKIAMPAQYCNLLTGYASLETLYRSLYYSKDLAQRYRLPFDYANITDVPTYTGAYPSVLASAGVRYWTGGANNDRAPVFFHEHWNERSPFWWEGPDGKKVLFWYSRHYMQVQTLFGLPPMLAAIHDSLPIYLQAFSKPTYKPDAVLIFGTQVENTDLVPETATFVDQWNEQYAWPKLRYATFIDFFHYMDEHYGGTLPIYKGDGGPYWEDGAGSDAFYTAEDRRNQNRALSAEVLSSATRSVDANLGAPRELIADIWRNILLFAEHTWTSWNSISSPDHEEAVKQLEVKDDRATRAKLEIDDLVNRSMSQLADQIHIPANTLVVFNSLNWRRDAVVETDLFEHAGLTDLTTREAVPLEVLSHREGFLRVRFLARDLPAVGYKCFDISYGERGGPAESAPGAGPVENDFYRITLDAASGAVSSVYDKQLKRELVDTASPYKFGQYLYVTGGDGRTRMIHPDMTLAPAKLTVHAAAGGRIVGVRKLPWGRSAVLESRALHTPRIRTEILLFERQKKIEFRYTVQKAAVTTKEGVYFAFPVAAAQPRFSYATQQGWVDPARDLMKGASLEWFNVQYWMAAYGGGAAVGIVPVDAPLASFGDINRGAWPGEFHPKSATLFSYAMNNYWHTNYRAAQGGDFAFRYVVTSAADLEPEALTRLAFESMRPVEVNYVVGQDKPGNPERPLPPEGSSFLETDQPDVALITWKQAEDGDGVILRLQETAGRATNAVVHFPRAAVRSANVCSAVEGSGGTLAANGHAVTVRLGPWEVVTVRVRLGGAPRL
jgi:alpha-mannosidase